MRKTDFGLLVVFGAILFSCGGTEEKKATEEKADKFPAELTTFTPYEKNPVFAGTGTETWDSKIRERGFIMKEGDEWSLWYTGYSKTSGDETKYLGLATSDDGLSWERYSERPVYDSLWVEDMFVWKENGTYYMAAEGRDDVAHLLTSDNRVTWTSQGALDVRQKSGQPLTPGPYGTPTLWKENNTWYLFYERNDHGIWLATSEDMKVWTNVQDEPVIAMGPESYDQYAVAMNQVIKYKGRYYGYYHASAFEDWREWTMNIAVSDDLVHWEKYEGNPIMKNNLSSGMVVETNDGFRFYTMHPEVNAFLPVK